MFTDKVELNGCVAPLNTLGILFIDYALITFHISPPASAHTSTKPPSDVERGHSSVKTHNMQELIKRIKGNYDKYVHRDSVGKST